MDTSQHDVLLTSNPSRIDEGALKYTIEAVKKLGSEENSSKCQNRVRQKDTRWLKLNLPTRVDDDAYANGCQMNCRPMRASCRHTIAVSYVGTEARAIMYLMYF